MTTSAGGTLAAKSRGQGSILRRFMMRLSPGTAPTSSPILLAEIELSRRLPDTSIQQEIDHYETVRVLVRLHGKPLGVLQLPVKSYCDTRALAREIEAEFESDIDAHLDEDGVARTALALRDEAFDVMDEVPRCVMQDDLETFVSVVVPTVGRPSLRECVQSILSSTHRNLEVIVVDNAPDNPFCLELVCQTQAHDSRVRYEAEPVSGASRARNVGLRAAQGGIVAFTDDDVVVDPQWLQSLVNGFGRSQRIMAVTGLTEPMRLETSAEIAFEQFGGFGRGFRQRLWDNDSNRGNNLLYPYTLGFGASSNNLAVVKDIVLMRGGFDERFGPATPTYASEDGELVLALVLDGHQVSYEPSALIRHAHRREWEELKWQVFTYAAGKSAMMTKYVISDRKAAVFFVRQVPKVLSKAVRGSRRVATGANTAALSASTQPPKLLLLEYLGFLYGPVAYARSVAESRKRLRSMRREAYRAE